MVITRRLNAKMMLLFFCLFSISMQAQPWLSYKLTPRGDTINRLDQQKMKQGPWVLRFETLRGEPGCEEEGYFLDDKKDGAWRRYSLMGDLIARENYKGGYRDGKQQYFTQLGDILREESYKAVDPKNPYDTIIVPDLDHPDRMVEKVIKHEGAEVKNGTWTYYSPSTGDVVKTEKFVFGQLEKKGLQPTLPKIGPVKDTSAAPVKKQLPKEVQEYEKTKKKGKG
ncbi:MAG: hypothetical protein RJB31_916 [Bacteroidota bacterium]|jgi:hypothetical protein